ncbi:hypothetical protein INF26_06285 [Olsenella sp. DSM 107455]|uniref:Bacterial transcriptional activator domain-containing protein n=1 Tax=Thermophilibacter gallinarum TaxID=2779357 RepID=A0ABR9QTR3_9ACTN|nr:bacterial transcriptional activator domain-containing protein [Thermophilibacter gallinarum]MBE5024461.1 hypothetical protein [Thermophilibacter gallinarum]
MECGTVITRVLAEAARSGARVVRRGFSGASPESATRSLTRLARELDADSRLIAIGLDDLPPSDESCTLRQARALRKLWSAGALVLFSVYPEARQLVERLPECTKVSAALLLDQCVSAPETDRCAHDRARLTRGIPRLARALGARGKERPVDSPSPAYLDALGEVVELSLRPTLSDEERRLRLAMLLLGRGTRGDLRLVLGEAPSDLLEGLRADAPLFGVSGGLRRFCALSSLSRGSLLTCLRHASSACALFPDVPAACLGLLVDHGDLRRAAALATLPECAPALSKVVSRGAEFLDLGEVALVLHSLKLAGDERPDAAGRLESAARALTSSHSPLALDARGSARVAGEAESLFVDARRVLRGELPIARPDTPVRGRLRNRLMAHVRACVLMRRGAFSAALAMLVCGPEEGERESVSGGLLAIDRELARLMTGGSPRESSPAAEQAEGFMRRRPLKGLMGYVAVLDLVRALMSDDDGSVAELEALSSRYERSEDTLVQIVALACGAVADLRGGSAARAKIRASLAGTLAHGAGVEYLERASRCVAEIAAVRLGEGLGPATTEGQSDDLGSVCALVRGVLLSDDGSAIPSLPEGIPWDAVWLIRVLGTGLGKFSLGLIEGMPTAWRRAASANGPLRPHAAAPKVPASQGGPGKTRKPVDLRLLGGFELRVRGVLIADWKLERRNAKAMLEYLVLHGGGAKRFQLVDQVWPDSDYDSGFNRAYQATSVLRREVAEIDPNLSLLMAGRTSGEIMVDTSVIGCDVDAFRAAAREAVDSRDDARKLEYARAAERLYVGDLYVPTLDATGFISSMRESLRNLYADAMVEGSAAALRLGRERTATRLAENAVRANELREDANSALVRALRACGRGVEADRRLRSFEARLRRGRGELTAAPDETAGQ